MTIGHRTAPVIQRLDRNGVLAIASEWDDLVADSPAASPFMSWAWVGSWLDTVGRDADLEISVARDAGDNRLLGIAPFFVDDHRRGGLGFRSLRLVGSGAAAPDHLDMPIRSGSDPRVAVDLWAAVHRYRSWDIVDLDGVLGDGALARLAVRRREDGGAVDAIPCPYLPLAGGWDAVTARFSPSHWRNIGRYGRKLRRDAGDSVVERMVVSPADLETTMDRLEELHQKVRAAHGDQGAFAHPAQAEFHREVARRMLADGRLRLWRLDVGDEAIAVIECFRFGDTVAFYATGYDLDWASFGPGRAIMARAIRGAVDEGAAIFDFLRGDEEYKQLWGTEVRHDLRIRRPAGGRGRALWMGRAAISRLKRPRGASRSRT